MSEDLYISKKITKTVCSITDTVFCRHLESFIRNFTALNYSEKSILSYAKNLKRFFLFLAVEKKDNFQDITPELLEKYRLSLIRDKLTGNTVSCYLRTVRKFFKYLEKESVLFINPAVELREPECRKKILYVPSESEVEKLLASADITSALGIRDRAIIETLYSTGMRNGELTGLGIFDIDFKNRAVRVKGKGRKERTVPLGTASVMWLEKYIKEVRTEFLKNIDESVLWLTFSGKPFNDGTLYRILFEHSIQAGLKQPVSSHALRRACATHMLRSGAHPVHIQLLLGHSDLRVLSRYLRVTITDLKKTHSESRPGQ